MNTAGEHPGGADPPPAAILHDRDFITLYRALEPALCRAIVERFDRDPGKRPGRVGLDQGAARQEAIKQSWDLEIPDAGAWREIFQAIHPPILACLAHYLARSPVLQGLALQGTGYKIQMYPRNQGFFRWHADAVGADADRLVAMVLYLNDVARGGETEFFHQGLKIAPRVGQLLLFPAGWNYMHRGRVAESGDKYVVSSFVRARR